MVRFVRSVFSFERSLGFVLLASILVIYYANPRPVEFLRLKTFDSYQQFKPRAIPRPLGKPVTIIDLDEESLNEVGQWPWPRTIIAKLVLNLNQMGAALVAFDIVFAEPDRMNPDKIPDVVQGLDEKASEKLRALPSNDHIFAKAMKKSRVILGQAGYWDFINSKSNHSRTRHIVISYQTNIFKSFILIRSF